METNFSSQDKELDVLEKCYQAALRKDLESRYRVLIKKKVETEGAVSFYKSVFRNLPDGHSRVLDLEELDEIENSKGIRGKLSSDQTCGLFVTLSPEPGTVTAIELVMLLKKVFMKTKKGISAAAWSIEKHGKKSDHVHAHILILTDRFNQSSELGKMKRWLQGRFSSLKTKTDAYLDIKKVSSSKWQDQCKYIIGEKDDEKMEGVEKDRIWREEEGIEQFYYYPPEHPILTMKKIDFLD